MSIVLFCFDILFLFIISNHFTPNIVVNEQCVFKVHQLPKVIAQEHTNWWWPFKFSSLSELPGHLMSSSKVWYGVFCQRRFWTD